MLNHVVQTEYGVSPNAAPADNRFSGVGAHPSLLTIQSVRMGLKFDGFPQPSLVPSRASKTTVLNICSEARIREILCRRLREQSVRLTSGLRRFIKGTRIAFCSWLLTNVPMPICRWKSFEACPGINQQRIDQLSTDRCVPPSVYIGFRLFVLLGRRSGDLSSMPWRVRGTLDALGELFCRRAVIHDPVPPPRRAPDPTSS